MQPADLAAALAKAARDAWCDNKQRTDLHDDVGVGADGTATSRIDRILDDAILAAAADLDLSIVSEESGLTDAGGPLTAIVDPLDGSRNAGRGIPFFCTSIAIAQGPGVDQLLAGHVLNLVTDDVYQASKGQGTTCNGRAVSRPTFNPDEVMVAVIADTSADVVQQEQERRGHHVRDLGSAALELSLVATGALDAFLVREPWLRNIDVAAGILLVQESGGIVQSPNGKPIPLDFDVSSRLALVAAGSQLAMEAVS